MEQKKDLTINNWVVGWTPSHSTPAMDKMRSSDSPPIGAVKIGPWDKKGWWDAYESSGGCCDEDYRNGDLSYKVMLMFITFHTLVVRDGIDPQILHREFLKIGEYRRRIAVDLDGAKA